MEFNRLLRGASDASYGVVEGDLPALQGHAWTRGIQYVITLDADTSFRTALFANSPGIDVYATAYQDLFGEGSFTGKGIYDVRAFEQMLADVFPETRFSATT